MIMNNEYMEDILMNFVGVSEEALVLVLKINGTRKEVYEDILFVRTGYHDFEQYLEEVGNEY